MNTRVLEWPRSVKRLVVVGFDVIVALVAMWLAFTLRLDQLHWPMGAQWVVYALGPLLAIPIFIKFGLYRAIFRYSGMAALTATALATAVYGALLIIALLVLQNLGFPVIPRSIGVLQPILFLLMVGAGRAGARFWLAGLARGRGLAEGRLLIYGAGSAGAQTAAALQNGAQFVLIGFIDDDPAKIGQTINGLRVHPQHAVSRLIEQSGVTDVLLALPGVSRTRRNQILQHLSHLPLRVRTLPSLTDLASGRVTVQDLKELDEEDLLGRDPVPPDPTLLSKDVKSKVVLVTGAGGSIGSELCVQILGQRPRKMVLLEHHEFSLYEIQMKLDALRQMDPTDLIEVIPILGSVTDTQLIDHLFTEHQPHTVYHAAAYKHVPMVEHNVVQGAFNNILGTLTVARVALRHRSEKFVLISTDKAVRPTNIMGATKRVAELILQALASNPAEHRQTCFAMVRFGNVLGSSGSVVPLFRRQIARGGPVTVTHPEVTRYFMTIPEAVQLVLQAGAMATGGEVFVLDMGEPVKIADMARRMISLSGLSVGDDDHPQGDVQIVFTGLRPGEKLYEELLIGNNPGRTPHDRIRQARETSINWQQLTSALAELEAAISDSNQAAVRLVLAKLVPEAGLGSMP